MNLFSPADRRPVHFVGIGGAGMSALALIACRRGVAVTGCDSDPGGAADLAALGVTVYPGHDPSHVEGARAVVVTAAVPAGHPELAPGARAGIPVVPRKEALAALIARARSVAISGTHGKTTTTVMTTEALTAAGLAPTGIAGGRVSAWGGNARLAGDELFVVEADEYDKAFLTLHPTVAVVNNVEADHLECYGSVAALEEAFVEFAGRARDGAGERGRSRRAAGRGAGEPAPCGGSASTTMADLRITDVAQRAERTEARVVLARMAAASRVRLQVPGIHNLRNAVAALGAVDALGGNARAPPRTRSRSSRAWDAGSSGWASTAAWRSWTTTPTILPSSRRRSRPRGRRFRAGGSSRSSSRTCIRAPRRTATRWVEALAAADLVVVTEVYAAREQPIPGVSGRLVADAAARAGADAHVRADCGRRWAGGCTTRSGPATSSSRSARATSPASVPSWCGG